MLKRIALGFAFVAILAFAAAPLFSGDADKKCPQDHLCKAFYCADCKAFLGESCGKCTADKMCDACKKASMCEHCKKNMGAVDACMRVSWTCATDKVCQLAKGTCPTCKKDLVETKSYALMVWKCPGCGADMKEGAKCEKCKMDAAKTCSMSGTCPHIAK